MKLTPHPSARPADTLRTLASAETAEATDRVRPAVATPGVRRIHSSSLFSSDQAEVQIEHQQQVYRLRRTALGKLILTK